MILYGYWRSSATYRVRILLNLKNVTYTYEPIHLLNQGGEQYQEGYLAKSPMGQVPVLALDEGGAEVYLSQSVAISEYLEEHYPDPSLYPSTQLGRAQARELVEMVNSGIQPLQNLRVTRSLQTMGADPKAWCQEVIGRGFRAIEQRLAQTAGTFAVGDSIGVVDAFLVPQAYAARRFGVDIQLTPILARVVEAAEAVSEVQAAHPDQQPDAVGK